MPLFTKQYKGRWCSAGGKVTAGLTSHWPCVTDSVVYPPTGSMAWDWERETSTPPTIHWSTAPSLLNTWNILLIRRETHDASTTGNSLTNFQTKIQTFVLHFYFLFHWRKCPVKVGSGLENQDQVWLVFVPWPVLTQSPVVVFSRPVVSSVVNMTPSAWRKLTRVWSPGWSTSIRNVCSSPLRSLNVSWAAEHYNTIQYTLKTKCSQRML